MTNTPGGWLPLIFTNVVSGTIGALISTFGTQARDRRAARAQVRTCLTHVEAFAYHPNPSHPDLIQALDDLEGVAFTAGVPWYVIALYKDVRLLAYAAKVTTPSSEARRDDSPTVVSGRVAHQAAVLLIRVLWHPLLTAPVRRWRAWHLRRVLYGGMPARAINERNSRRGLRKWERQMIRRRKNSTASKRPTE